MSVAAPPDPLAAPLPEEPGKLASPPAGLARSLAGPAATALVVFVLVAAGFALLNLAWLRDLRAPRVVLLGSGDRLSVLVLAGDARLLIATGDDPIAFGNALERQRRPAQRRLDVAVVAGTGNDLRAPAAVAADPNVRLLAAMVPLAQVPDDSPLRGLPTLAGTRQVTLDEGVTVTLESEPGDGVNDEPAAWRAIVERGESRVVILSDGAAADRFPPPPPAGLLVVAGGKPLDGWNVAPTTLLAHADAAIDPRKLREAAANGAPVPRYGVRVHPGDSVALRFVEGGVELPPDAAVALGAPANATPDRR